MSDLPALGRAAYKGSPVRGGALFYSQLSLQCCETVFFALSALGV